MRRGEVTPPYGDEHEKALPTDGYLKTVCPSCRRIPKKIQSKRAIHAVRTRTKYIIAKTRSWFNYKSNKNSLLAEKKHPSFPRMLRACQARAIPCRLPAKPEQAGQACRSRPRKIPHKSPALPDFYTAARAAAARPRPPCGREGVIAPGFSGTGGVSKGDSVPLRRRRPQPSHTSSCSPFLGRPSSSLMPSCADIPP